MSGNKFAVGQKKRELRNVEILEMIEKSLEGIATGPDPNAATKAEVARLRLRDRKHAKRIARNRRQIRNLRLRLKRLEDSLNRTVADQSSDDSSSDSS